MLVRNGNTDRRGNAGQWREWIDRPVSMVKQKLRLVPAASTARLGGASGQDGVTFRVWAPHAESVAVAGTFNGWSHWRTPLAPEGDGHWSTKVAAAQPGDRYKYVIRRAGGTLLRTDPYARGLAGAQQDSVVVADTVVKAVQPRFRMPPIHELVIYELHVGTFTRHGRRPVGTFAGVAERLPYLRGLGVNAIELMPVAEFAGLHSWGYNPAHPFVVARAYGGRAALQELVQAAHEHGIAVIVDVVYNHFGPQDLALWQFDGWHEHNLGGIYFYNDWRAQTPWAHTRPDYGRAEVRRYLRDNAFMWLEEIGVDGLRWDATAYIRNAHGHDGDRGADIAEGWELMRAINHEIHVRLPGKVSIAEDMQDNIWLTRNAREGGAGFDTQWDAKFVHVLRRALIPAQDEQRDMRAVAAILAQLNPTRAFDRVIYSESHDEVANGKARLPEEIAPNQAANTFARKRAALAAALVMTAPGIPMLFQGQEFLEDGWFDDRVPLDWSKTRTQRGNLILYRDLIRLRRNLGGRTRGLQGEHTHVFHVNNRDKLIAFHRWKVGGAGDDVVVVINFANRAYDAYTLGFPRPGLWRPRFNSDRRIYGEAYTDRVCSDIVAARTSSGSLVDGMPCWGNVMIGPYATLILSQEPA